MSARLNAAFSRMAAMFMAAVITLFPLSSQAEQLLQLPDGSKADLSKKCPVCGMVIGGKDGQGATVTFKDGRVSGFHGVAAAVFKDGHSVGFDGARCLFIYNSFPQKYEVNLADIAHQYVTDYVSKKMIALSKAFLVLGSEVKGPMGYELIAFNSMAEASKFASENDGKWIVRLHEVPRAAQEEPDNTKANKRSDAPGVSEETTPAPSVEPGVVQPEERAIETPKGRSATQQTQDLEPSEPFVGRSGHHGGGHMH